jgi:signal peptidase I
VSSSFAKLAARYGSAVCTAAPNSAIPSAEEMVNLATASGHTNLYGNAGSEQPAATRQTQTTIPPQAGANTGKLLKGLRTWRIPAPSMLPTLPINSVVLSESSGTTPTLGQIIVFHPPAGADPINPVCGNSSQGAGHSAACDEPTPKESRQTFIKRVVGLPGDHIRILNGDIYRNGVKEDAPYTEPCSSEDTTCTFTTTITVPPGDCYVLGDNREESDDSRFWGPVPQAYIIGIVVSCQPASKYCTG